MAMLNKFEKEKYTRKQVVRKCRKCDKWALKTWKAHLRTGRNNSRALHPDATRHANDSVAKPSQSALPTWFRSKQPGPKRCWKGNISWECKTAQKVGTVSQKHEVAWGKHNGFRGVKKYVHRRSQKYEENGGQQIATAYHSRPAVALERRNVRTEKTVNWRWLNVGIACCSMTWQHRLWKPRLSQVASVLGSLRTFLPPQVLNCSGSWGVSWNYFKRAFASWNTNFFCNLGILGEASETSKHERMAQRKQTVGPKEYEYCTSCNGSSRRRSRSGSSASNSKPFLCLVRCCFFHLVHFSFPLPVVRHKAVAEVSRIRNLKERLVVASHGCQRKKHWWSNWPPVSLTNWRTDKLTNWLTS